ncbi:secondary carrier transporter [Lithospermum erythrorhizon]|uniref:Secondary carrier transporter n=1 Tax=Lithospermum erythrorhizon TaxID=34254 RepID=A0AAV3QR94_LITER
MKFGKEYASQMVQEWQEAYLDYNYLKSLLKDILYYKQKNIAEVPIGLNLKRSFKKSMSLYRTFSGLTSRLHSPRASPNHHEDEVILVSDVGSKQEEYQTMFLMSSEEGGDNEMVFFKKLDDEFNKVVNFYKDKVKQVKLEAEGLSRQMDALIALRLKVHKPLRRQRLVENVVNLELNGNSSPLKNFGKEDGQHLDAIEEGEMGGESISDESSSGDNEPNSNNHKAEEYNPASLRFLNQVKINIEPETPRSTLKNVLNCSLDSDLSFSKVELKKAEEKLRLAFTEFYQKLGLLKNFSFLNQLAVSKIMKKYEKITSRTASKSYLEMVDNSYLGSSDEVSKLREKVEITYIKHFCNGNRRKGMKSLRPQAKRERHRVTFSLGLFTGCSIALIVGIIVSLRAREIISSEGRHQYMENIFPLYSLFGYIVLHMIMYSGNIYFWRRFRVNYPFIFNFKQGTELGYRQVLLVASGLSVLALAATLSNLDMEMNPDTKSYQTLTELVPLCLVAVVLLISFCPFNVIYRSSRYFLLKSVWRCFCAPLYKVTLIDFFLADQLTSQVQALRSLLFYACYYGWGDFKKRSHKCHDSDIYQIFNILIVIIPFWARFLQCVRRCIEEKDSLQGLNSLKYLSTIIALVLRTLYDVRKGTTLKIMAAVSSGLTTIVNTYWDVVIDWGLLNRNSKNAWLRDRLLVPMNYVYFVAIVINILLRLVWMQLVLDFTELPFLHRRAFIAVVASLEIIRRGIWNFFRLENEHLNNVGGYRAFKSVPLPFNYDDEKSL